MRRMKLKVHAALEKCPMEDWSVQLLRRQFRLAHRVGTMTICWPARVSQWHPPSTIRGAGRSRGRPAVRWDDRLRQYSHAHFEIDWYTACLETDFPRYEDAFVRLSLRHQQ